MNEDRYEVWQGRVYLPKGAGSDLKSRDGVFRAALENIGDLFFASTQFDLFTGFGARPNEEEIAVIEHREPVQADTLSEAIAKHLFEAWAKDTEDLIRASFPYLFTGSQATYPNFIVMELMAIIVTPWEHLGDDTRSRFRSRAHKLLELVHGLAATGVALLEKKS